MSPSRRHVIGAGLAVCGGLASAGYAGSASASVGRAAPGYGAGAQAAGSEDALASTYYLMLEKNTPFMESTWDDQTGSYPDTDFYFAGTLGNAVLLKFGTYDESATGVPRAQLQDHTLRSIAYAAAHNRFVNPSGDWGENTFWDSTFESYLAAAAHLMWDDLDDQTRTNITAIVQGEADRMTDPGLDVATTNYPTGGYVGDTKLEEFGTMTMPLAAALAYSPDHPHAPQWLDWLNRWMANMAGLPVADRVNPTPVAGTPVSANTAHNLYDTFIVENHGSWAPMYQQSIGAYPGRDIAQFLIAGRSAPPILGGLPNAGPMWETMGQLGTDAGVPEDFMVADRHHLYGRSLFPITYASMVLGDRYAACAEQLLADHLGPYVDYPPAGRLTKFSGEPKYEPEARAELGLAYLLHYWRDRLAGDVAPVSAAEYFQHFSRAQDYGAQVGLVAQQTPRALAAAVTKPGFVKFAFLPQHDDWLINVAGDSPCLLPSVAAVDDTTTRVYRTARDGFEATATLVRCGAGGAGYAGFTTLPDGTIVYATTGTADNEGILNLYNLDMPGVAGLDGDRTFTAAGGSVTLAADDTTTRAFSGSWLNIDGRAGFVVRGSANPISVSATAAILSAGPAAGANGMVVEGSPAQSPAATASAADAPAPSGGSATLRAALTGGYLSLFNLGGTAIDGAALTVPQGAAITLYQGDQHTTDAGTSYQATLAAATAQVQAPRFRLTSGGGQQSVPAGLAITVVDSKHVSLTNGGVDPVRLVLESTATGESREFALAAGQTSRVNFAHGPLTPVTDLARAQLTYPVAPLPAGMSDPARAVDGDPATAWIPGADDRNLVVDLDGRHTLTGACLEWTDGVVPPYTINASDDGVTWTQLVSNSGSDNPRPRFTFSAAANYLSVHVLRWSPGDAGLTHLSVAGEQQVPDDGR